MVPCKRWWTRHHISPSLRTIEPSMTMDNSGVTNDARVLPGFQSYPPLFPKHQNQEERGVVPSFGVSEIGRLAGSVPLLAYIQPTYSGQRWSRGRVHLTPRKKGRRFDSRHTRCSALFRIRRTGTRAMQAVHS